MHLLAPLCSQAQPKQMLSPEIFPTMHSHSSAIDSHHDGLVWDAQGHIVTNFHVLAGVLRNYRPGGQRQNPIRAARVTLLGRSELHALRGEVELALHAAPDWQCQEGLAPLVYSQGCARAGRDGYKQTSDATLVQRHQCDWILTCFCSLRLLRSTNE